ncbi:uncharacterized protein LOC142333994 [Lycorma delicatula]|uniref:uncharacterized protein LOC142333994 n=1 Tax=Lycorma delicatula TaxID=130591 RepID=UPI003F517BA2
MTKSATDAGALGTVDKTARAQTGWTYVLTVAAKGIGLRSVGSLRAASIVKVMNIGLVLGRVLIINMTKLLLANANRSTLSHDLLHELAFERDVDLLVITEPNRYESAKSAWIAVGDVVIRNVSNRMALSFKERAEGVIATELDSIIIVAAYVSPNISIIDYKKFLDSIYRILSRQNKKFVLLGDFNCKTVYAGCSHSNRRGELMEEFMESIDGHCINDGTPTYEARGHYLILDLVIIDNRWLRDQCELTVLDNDIASDHFSLQLVIRDGTYTAVERPIVIRPTARQVDKTVDKVSQRLSTIIELTPDTLTSIIQQEMDREIRATRSRRQVYWWSNEVAYFRNTLQQARKKQRPRIRGGSEYDTAELYRGKASA